MSLLIKLTVELSHVDRFRIENMGVNFIEGLKRVIFKISEGSLENFKIRGFSSSCGSYNHETVSNLDGIVELKDLFNEGGYRLKIEPRIYAHICYRFQ